MSELAKVRRSKGFSQRALAEEAGVSPSSVYEIEVGRRKPNPGTLRKLASALDVEVVALLEEEERPKASSRLEVFELPGLYTALRRHGMSLSALASRTGMTPGEVLDYEIGAKKPEEEIVDRIADALGAARSELVFPPEQVEAHQAENARENREEMVERSYREIHEEQLKDPTHQLIVEAYEKKEADERASRSREDRSA